MSDDQDSKVVIGFRKNQTSKVTKGTQLNGNGKARRSGVPIDTEKKNSTGNNKANQGTDHQRIAKLDRENEVAPPAKVSLSVGRTMQDARKDLNLTQKDVAQMVNEKQSLIQDYESGKAIPNPQVLGKLERVLKVKLRGADIGKKLETVRK